MPQRRIVTRPEARTGYCRYCFDATGASDVTIDLRHCQRVLNRAEQSRNRLAMGRQVKQGDRNLLNRTSNIHAIYSFHLTCKSIIVSVKF